MAVEIDEKLFTWAVIAVIVMCLICAAALAFKLTDGFSFLKPAEPVPDYQYADAYGDTASETEDGPWDTRNLRGTTGINNTISESTFPNPYIAGTATA